MAKFVFLMLIIMSWATQAEDKKVLTVDASYQIISIYHSLMTVILNLK